MIGRALLLVHTMIPGEQQDFLTACQQLSDAAMYLAELWTQEIDDSMGWRVSRYYPFMSQFPYMASAIYKWNEHVQEGPNEP
jgi:hypothetical protein